MAKKATTPRSGYTCARLSGNLSSCFAPPMALSFIVGIIALISFTFGARWDILRWFVAAIAVIWVLNLWFVPKYYRMRQKILTNNAADYQASLRLIPILKTMATVPSDQYPIAEALSPARMQPFRVEHFVSSAVRADINGRVPWFGHFSASMSGISIPDLLDSSSVLWLTDGQDTMRVILPSSTAVRSMLAKTTEGLVKELKKGSHLQEALQGFVMDKEALLTPVSHPQLVDRLDASCELNIGQRPLVSVAGQEIQPGVVMATALQIGEQVSPFLPTGLFKQLATTVAEHAGLPAPKTPVANAAV